MIRRPLLAAAVCTVLVACKEPPTDDTPQPTDTDPGDTEITDLPSDTPTGDTELDTEDTDPQATLTTIRAVRLAATLSTFAPGDLLRIEGAVVVGVRAGGTGNGFSIQDPTEATFGGLFVPVTSSPTLPAVGDTVDVVGRYGEIDGISPPTDTRTALTVDPVDTATSWTATGTSGLPVPKVLSLPTFFGSAELYESMRVRIVDTPVEVSAGPRGDGTFDVWNGSGSHLLVGDFFSRPDAALPSLAVRDSFAAVGGIVQSVQGVLGVHPVTTTDLEGYSPFVAPTDTDTDLVATDTIGPPSDTDTQVDTELSDDPGTDTLFQFTMSDTDTDLEVDTDLDQSIVTTTADIRSGFFPSNGVLLRVNGLVVTAVRFRTVPATTNGFTAQDPVSNTGIYVHMANLSNLPAVGDVVDVVGSYEEYPIAASRRYLDTESRLVVYPATYPLSQVIVQGTAALPAPIAVDVEDIRRDACNVPPAPCPREALESVRITLDEPAPITVSGNPINNIWDFEIEDPADAFIKGRVSAFYHTLYSGAPGQGGIYDVDVGDTFDTMTGVLRQENFLYEIAPTSAADVTGYVDN